MTAASNGGPPLFCEFGVCGGRPPVAGPFQALPIGARAPYLVGQREYGGGERAWWLERSSQPCGGAIAPWQV